MKNILTIAKREIMGYLNTPTAYIVTVAFIVPSYFLFWRQALMTNEASLRPFFSLMPWFLLLVIPALTMRALAEERSKNTIELLLSQALSEWEVIVGKFLGVWVFYGLILAVTLSLPFTLFKWASPDVGELVGQYLGAVFMGGAMIAMGLLVSSWFNQAITAFLVAAGIGFAWILLGLDIVVLALPWPVNQVAQQLALLPHADQLARGSIELRDIVYFVTVTLVLLALAGIKLLENKLVENLAKRSRLYTGAVLIAAIGVVINLMLISWPVRLDLTADKRFTLSAGTKATLSSLPDIVSITFYSSQNLPAQVEPIRMQIVDTLKDYTKYGKDKVKVSILHPETNSEIAQQAAQAGVQQIQFNTIASGRYSVEAGYLGLVIRYGDKKETIGYVQNIGDLEYDLTQRIRKLTAKTQPTVGFLTGQGEKTLYSDLSNWQDLLSTQYQTNTVTVSSPEDKIDSKVLVVAGPTSSVKEATASSAVKDFLANKGKVMFLLDGVQANPQIGSATPIDTGWDELLQSYGLKLNKDVAYDVQLNENIRIGKGLVQYILPYSFWLRALPADTTGGQAPFKVPEGVLLAWPSSIEVNQDQNGVQVHELLKTSQAGGKLTGSLNIAPDSVPKKGSGQPVLVGATAEKDGSKVVLVGDSELATNDFMQNNQPNQLFLSQAIDWLAADENVAQVPRRLIAPALLKFTSPRDTMMAQYGNIIGIPVLVGLFGFWWLRRRNGLTKREYFGGN